MITWRRNSIMSVVSDCSRYCICRVNIKDRVVYEARFYKVRIGYHWCTHDERDRNLSINALKKLCQEHAHDHPRERDAAGAAHSA